jgi:hypothetical protein
VTPLTTLCVSTHVYRYDYEEPYRSDILDLLFKPNWGAAVHHMWVLPHHTHIHMHTRTLSPPNPSSTGKYSCQSHRLGATSCPQLPTLFPDVYLSPRSVHTLISPINVGLGTRSRTWRSHTHTCCHTDDYSKVEIGGDGQSTDGTEASHMHDRDDLSCKRPCKPAAMLLGALFSCLS